MTTILATAFWLVITVHGEVVYQRGPLTAEDCSLQLAYRFIQVERLAAEGAAIVLGGREVDAAVVEVGCLPGEKAT